MPVNAPQPGWQIAECLLPGVTRAAAEALGRRIAEELAGHPRPGVAFHGSFLMPEDEVLLCLFSGTRAEVALVSERAALPFERIVGCVRLGWDARPGEAGSQAPGTEGAP